MEEAKAAAYYDELTRKGQGAARFKQGLGFSSNSTTDDAVPARGSALPSSSSPFLSKFVRASSPSKASELEKQAQLESIQNKLKKKPKPTSSETIKQTSTDRTKEKDRYRDQHSRLRSLSHSRSPSRDRDRHSRRRSRSQSKDRDIHSRRRSRDGYRSRRRHRHPSRSTSRDGDRDRRRDRDRKRRSRSRTVSDEDRGRRRGSRSASPREPMSEKSRGDSDKVAKERNGGTDYSRLIEGYDTMAPAERVKAKMKLQLSETAEKDEAKGSGWERFEFNRDAPVDDEDIEAVEDDAALVKHLGQSFRFSAMEAKRDEKIKAAHDEAIFGALTHLPSNSLDDEEKNDYKRESTVTDPVTNLISEQVLARQHGSWRERARQV